MFAAGVGAALTGFFELWRLILLVMLDAPADTIPVGVLLQSFLVGLRFDLAIAAYVVAPIYLLAVLPVIGIQQSRLMRRILTGVVALAAAFTFFLHLCDIEFFRFFNARLNGMALQWEDTPGFVLPMVWQTYPVIGYLLLYLLVIGLFVVFLRWIVRVTVMQRPRSSTALNLLWLVPTLAMVVLAARGRIEEKAPLTWGAAYFSEYNMANQLALTPTFTFLRDAVYDAGSRQHTRALMDEISFPEAESLVREMLGLPAEAEPARLRRQITYDPPDDEPPNVILVIMESFGSSHIGCLDSRLPYDLTPRFDVLATDGILFTNLYSGGSHTYTGILSSVYGYPTIYGKSIMKMITGQNRFVGLPGLLRAHGYETLFFTTHDPQFDNMQGFLMANGFMRVYSLFDYDRTQQLSTLGVPDHVMFDYAIDAFRDRGGEPFTATLLTATNHGPWLVPDVPFGALPEDTPDKQRLDAFKYSDWALGRFVDQLSADATFDNTLLVITADNGMLHEARTDLDLTQFQLPLLIVRVGDIGRGKGARVDLLGSQMDIVATIMGRTRLNYTDYTFGRDLLDSTRSGETFAEFSDWDKIGFIQDGFYSITRLGGPGSLYRIEDSSRQIDPQRELSDSLPGIAREMQRRALAMFQTAYFNALLPLTDSSVSRPESADSLQK